MSKSLSNMLNLCLMNCGGNLFFGFLFIMMTSFCPNSQYWYHLEPLPYGLNLMNVWEGYWSWSFLASFSIFWCLFPSSTFLGRHLIVDHLFWSLLIILWFDCLTSCCLELYFALFPQTSWHSPCLLFHLAKLSVAFVLIDFLKNSCSISCWAKKLALKVYLILSNWWWIQTILQFSYTTWLAHFA